MFHQFTRNLSTNIKNEKIMKKILKYQSKIKDLIIENKLPMTGYTYSYSFGNNNKFDEEKYLKEEKKIITKMNKFYNS